MLFFNNNLCNFKFRIFQINYLANFMFIITCNFFNIG